MVAHPECLRSCFIPPHPNPLPRRGEGDQGSDFSEAAPVSKGKVFRKTFAEGRVLEESPFFYKKRDDPLMGL
jgi:hypothetical protein